MTDVSDALLREHKQTEVAVDTCHNHFVMAQIVKPCPNGMHCFDGQHTFEVVTENNTRREYAVGVACTECDVYESSDEPGKIRCEGTGKVVETYEPE